MRSVVSLSSRVYFIMITGAKGPVRISHLCTSAKAYCNGLRHRQRPSRWSRILLPVGPSRPVIFLCVSGKAGIYLSALCVNATLFRPHVPYCPLRIIFLSPHFHCHFHEASKMARVESYHLAGTFLCWRDDRGYRLQS